MRYDGERIVKPIDRPRHVSLLLPTRGRPEYLDRVFGSIADTARDPDGIDVWIYVDHDDHVTRQYIGSESYRRYPFRVNWVFGERTLSQGRMVNVLRQRCTTNPGIYLPCGDDYLFKSTHWDDAIRAAFDRYPDRIVLGYIPQPHLSPEQVIFPVLSAHWTNVTGKIFTELFPFWSDDTWLDHVSQMVRRKVRIEIRVGPIEGMGRTPRLKNLPFWQRFFTHLTDERLVEAKLLLRAIYPQDCPEYQQSIEEAAKRADAIAEQREKVTTSYLSALEQKHSSFPSNPEPHLVLLHLSLEAKAAGYLFAKTDSLIQAGDFNRALKMLATVALAEQGYKHTDDLRAACLERLESAGAGSQTVAAEYGRQAGHTEGPRFSFVMIVLNGMPFIECSLKSIYAFAHEIIVVEGAVEQCMFAANPDGSSTDGTVEFLKSFPDPQNKIELVQGRWPEKCEMQNEALRYVTGDYVWLIDSDEVYKREDLDKIKTILTDDPSITQVNFIPDNFWKGLDHIFTSSRFFEPACHYRRLFKYVRGALFTSHRPPTMKWPDTECTTEQMHLLDGHKTRRMGIIPYHYSYVLDEQVRQKIELYNRYGWDRDWNINLRKWYKECFLKWTPANKHTIEVQHPVWTGDTNSRTQLFKGTHPEVMRGFKGKLIENKCRPQEQTLRVIGDPYYQDGVAQSWNFTEEDEPRKRVRVAADYVQSGARVETQSSFGAKIQELFARIRPKKIIETGTYLGTGTTTIIARALEALGIDDATFYTIEVNPQIHARAKEYLSANNLKVHALNGLSVPRSMLPDRDQIARSTITEVDYDGIFADHSEADRVALYYNETDFPEVDDALLHTCLKQFDFRPDFVLLDSAGHIGSIEFDYLIENLQGQCTIALDDIYHVKHYRSFKRIQSDPRFEIVTKSREKFGFCIARFTPGPTPKRIDGDFTTGNNTSVKRVLVVRSDSIGDFVIFSGALPYYRKLYPDAEIVIVIPAGVTNLAEACPFIDEIITSDRGKMVSQPRYATEFIHHLRSRQFDVAICPAFSRDKVSDFIAINSGAAEKITCSGNTANLPADVIEANNVHYTRVVPMSGGIALETFRNEEFLKGLGVELDGPYRPTVWTTQADKDAAEHLLNSRGIKAPIVIAPFAQRDIRNWPVENWVKLVSGYPAVPVVICGTEKDRPAAEKIINAANHPNIHNLCGLTTVRQLAALIAASRLCISNESAAAHLAAAVNRPHVVLLGGGHFGRFMPYSPQTRIVNNPMDCYNCNWQCKYGRDIRCIATLSVDMVKRAVDESLGGTGVESALDSRNAAAPHEEDDAGQSHFLVSAIVSTYNSEKFIRGCLEDLENQTMADRLEIIVVNSGSQENEETIVREYQKKYNNIVYIKTEHREGIYAAWNRAVKAARGTFLTSANTDDRHREDALETMAGILRANPDVALVYGDQICTDTANGTFADHHVIEPARRPKYNRDRLLWGCCVGSQPMWRKFLHDEFGYFDETLTCASDWDFWLRISSKYTFKHIPEFLGLYYNNESGIEHGRKIHSLYERYAVGRRYGNPYISVIPLCESKGNPLVSVIMPAYNAADYVAEAIESVLIQNYRNFELIVVDDGSTDRTKESVSAFQDDKIRYFHQANAGPASARNLALKKCNGDFMVFLDADDMMTPDFLSSHLQEFEMHPQADLIYCDDALVDKNLKPIRVIQRPEYSERKLLIRDMFRCGFPVVPFRTCIRRGVFETIGFYDENLLVGEDYDMMRRFIKHGLNVHHLRKALYLRRMTGDSLSRSHSPLKARCHFEVVSRFIDTFTHEELFPDVPWHEIAPDVRPLHARCLAVTTYLAMGQDFANANSPRLYVKMAFGEACSQLNECLRIDPANGQIRQLLEKCERGRRQYEDEPPKADSRLCQSVTVNG